VNANAKDLIADEQTRYEGMSSFYNETFY